MTADNFKGYGIACKECRTPLLLVAGSRPFVPYLTENRYFGCPRCGAFRKYIGQMILVTSNARADDPNMTQTSSH